MDAQLGTHGDELGANSPPRRPLVLSPLPRPPHVVKEDDGPGPASALERSPEGVLDVLVAAALARRFRGRAFADSASGASMPEDENIAYASRR